MIHGTDRRYTISAELYDIANQHNSFTDIVTRYKKDHEELIVHDYDIEKYVIANYGSWVFSTYWPRPEEESELFDVASAFRQLWNSYIRTMQDNIDRVWYAYHVEYEPLDNYNKISDITTSYLGTEIDSTNRLGEEKTTQKRSGAEEATTTQEGSINSDMEYLGSQTDETKFEGSEVDTNTKAGSTSDTNVRSGSQTVANGAKDNFNIESVSPEDATNPSQATFYPTTRSDTHEGSRSDTTTYNDVTDSRTVEYSENFEDKTTKGYLDRKDTATRSFEDRKDKSKTSYEDRRDTTTYEFIDREDTSSLEYINRYDDTTKSFEDRQDVVSEHTHGNIGVTTSAQMLTGELEVRQLRFLNWIVDEFVYQYCRPCE